MHQFKLLLVAFLLSISHAAYLQAQLPNRDCILVSAPTIEVTIPPAPPTRLMGGFAVRCTAGIRVRAELTSEGHLHGPLDLPYRLDTPVISFTGTGQPQTIEFFGHITLSGAIGTMVMPSRYIDRPIIQLKY